jgi:hypothetical protein
MHLLHLSFTLAVQQRAADAQQTVEICTKQLTGLAGVAAVRIGKALNLPGGVAGVLRTMELHPVFNPAGYVDAEFADGRVVVHRSAAHDDGAWISLCSPGSLNALQAIATAVDPLVEVHLEGTATDWVLELSVGDAPRKEQSEVEVVKFSGGSTFAFEERKSLPLTVV